MSTASRVLNSEWTKITSVRSTLWTLVTALVVTVGLSALICGFTNAQWDQLSAQERATFDPTYISFSGMGLGQLAMIAFGVLVVSGEYSTGMIRSSLAAVPQRGVLMVCKVTVAVLLVLVVSMVISLSSFLVGQALLGEHRAQLGDPGVLRAVVGGGLYMTLMALFSMGLTFVLRSPLLAFAILMPFFFLVSNILGGVEATKKVAQYLPDQAGSRVMEVVATTGDRPYGPWGGIAIMLLWVAAALVAGYGVLRTRDA
ncbi:ABC transporter permease [Streptomyces sp. NPDC005438]|uniref:ABC transporter permease n=1 Tax=Streptomyces sp. NPDC005438 TaxID=3156880 RepID=UPI00339F5424